MRRRLVTGKKFDIVASCDLRCPGDQSALKRYVREYKPLVVIMAPLCTLFGSLGRLNEAIHYEGWYRSYGDGVPLPYMSGGIAHMQVVAG